VSEEWGAPSRTDNEYCFLGLDASNAPQGRPISEGSQTTSVISDSFVATRQEEGGPLGEISPKEKQACRFVGGKYRKKNELVNSHEKRERKISKKTLIGKEWSPSKMKNPLENSGGTEFPEEKNYLAWRFPISLGPLMGKKT